MNRGPSLSKHVLRGLLVLVNNPKAAEIITEVKPFSITPSELEAARKAAEWVRQMEKYRRAV